MCVVYAGVRGFLDKVQTSEIGKFEQGFLEHLRTRHVNVLDTIRTEGQLSQETDAKLKAILQEYIPSAGLKMKS